MLAPRRVVPSSRVLVIALSIVACSDVHEAPEADLPLGDVEGGDLKADDGDWGHALECKDIPDVPGLVSPRIVISLDGLTLHLTDASAGYDRVFPIGPGKIDLAETEATYRESLSYAPLISNPSGDFTINWAASTPCKTWWTDPETGEKAPVFAGLPFMSWRGNYAIHGPIDSFRAASGGKLRRGYVSHGCIRMEAADVLEVYARIHTVASVPVHVQRAPERTTEGGTIDVADKWIGSGCASDTECAFDNGFCAKNPFSERGFCSAHCAQYCADKPGYPSTFCTADPSTSSSGMCVPRVQGENFDCRPYEQFAPQVASRFTQPTVTTNVCLPSSPGWIGDHCFADSDCKLGTTCQGANGARPGTCTMACTAVCPDQPGYAETMCAVGGSCVRKCTPASNGSECPSDMACAPVARNAAPDQTRFACVAK